MIVWGNKRALWGGGDKINYRRNGKQISQRSPDSVLSGNAATAQSSLGVSCNTKKKKKRLYKHQGGEGATDLSAGPCSTLGSEKKNTTQRNHTKKKKHHLSHTPNRNSRKGHLGRREKKRREGRGRWKRGGKGRVYIRLSDLHMSEKRKKRDSMRIKGEEVGRRGGRSEGKGGGVS